MALSSAKSQEPAYGRSRHQRTISSPQQVVCSTLPEIKRFSLPHRTMTFSWTCERCLKGLVPEEKDDLLRARTCPLLLHARRPSLRSGLRAAARVFNNSRLITLHQIGDLRAKLKLNKGMTPASRSAQQPLLAFIHSPSLSQRREAISISVFPHLHTSDALCPRRKLARHGSA
jgi:hypothetical protein